MQRLFEGTLRRLRALGLPARTILSAMTSTYTITSRADLAGFDIAVVATDGSRHTMLGFKTMAEAEAWIEQDRRRDRLRAKRLPVHKSRLATTAAPPRA
jgi:hypothetical protein